ncbi:LysR family transcriptional regulator [Candidimonas nitroreducens]|uniref:LysR family transcriptional regulator n=1 Tax=Candidimonas nitroreducens TaxID=683354 RepID=A0A225N2Z7_9BURK|nr:LysR family transcriptional regulator [Candidimonas nitroreducens]OWT66231.1 LysR family transcriptional regulator [Candidimonas nitroreducens]
MSQLSQIDITALRLFIAIAQAGSISEGAARIHLSVAAASKRISDIESRIGVRLLRRGARGISLTPAGGAFHQKALAMMQLADTMEEELSDYAQGVEDRIGIMANAASILHFLPSDLASYLGANPRLRVDLQEQTSLRIAELLQSNQTDLGIFDADHTPMGVHTRPYREDRLMLVTARGHPLARYKHIDFAETLKYDYVGLHAGTAILTKMTQSAGRAGRLLRLRIQVNSFDAVCSMVESGIGIGIVPIRAAQIYLDLKRIAAAELDDPWAKRQLVLGWPAQRHLTPGATNLVEHLTRTTGTAPQTA